MTYKKTFEDFLAEKHAKENPMILDDNLSDAFNDWVSELDPAKIIEDADKFIEEKDRGFFTITSVHRDDLKDKGFDVSKVDDATMEQLARKMSEAYVENGFWVDLDIIAEDLGIPKSVGKSS